MYVQVLHSSEAKKEWEKMLFDCVKFKRTQSGRNKLTHFLIWALDRSIGGSPLDREFSSD